MRKLFVFVLIFSFLVAGTSALAQDKEPLSSGLTPDSPFYFLKTWKESIQTFFTFGAENKARQLLRLADERLAEYQKMVEKGKPEIAKKTLEKYKNQLDRSLGKIEEARVAGQDIGELAKSASTTIFAQQKVLVGTLEKMSSMEGLQQAPLPVQNCLKSLVGNSGDLQTMLKDCVPSGASSSPRAGVNMEMLKQMQRFYGNSLSPKDQKSLKEVQEQLRGVIPEGESLPSGQKIFNLEDIQKIQVQMQEEINKIPKDDLEYIKKMQEQNQN